jgi:hypothetical protein
LSICQAVVAAHGGTIEVASTLGHGTTFTVRLPDCRRPDPAEKPFASAPTWPNASGEDAAKSA